MAFQKQNVGVYSSSDFKPTFWNYLADILKAGIESSEKFAASVKNLEAFLTPILDNAALKSLKEIKKDEDILIKNAMLKKNYEKRKKILGRYARLRLSVLMLLIKRKGFFGIDELGLIEGEKEDDILEAEGVKLSEILEII